MDVKNEKKRSAEDDLLEFKLRRVSTDNEPVSDLSNDTDLIAIVRKNESDRTPNSIEMTVRSFKASCNTKERIALLNKEVSRLKAHNERLQTALNKGMEYKQLLDVRSKIGPLVKIHYNFGTALDGVNWSTMMLNLEKLLHVQHEEHTKELDQVLGYVVKLQQEVTELKSAIHDATGSYYR